MNQLDARLLQMIQGDFPLAERPFAEIAGRLGVSEAEVLDRLTEMREQGIVRSIRPMFELRKLGYVSTLVAAKVEEDELEQVAEKINAHPGVTHNYQRNYEYNVWFTLITIDEGRQAEVLDEIRALPGVLDLRSLPAKRTFKLRVDFRVGP